MCGASPIEVPVSVAKIDAQLRRHRARAPTPNPNVGKFEVKIKVRDNGKASGTITPTGLCTRQGDVLLQVSRSRRDRCHSARSRPAP